MYVTFLLYIISLSVENILNGNKGTGELVHSLWGTALSQWVCLDAALLLICLGLVTKALREVRPFLFSLLVKLLKWNPPHLYNPENYAVLIISILRKISDAEIIWNCWINWPNCVSLTTISCFWALCSKKNISFNKFYLWGTKQQSILANARNFSFKPWIRLFGKLIKLQ